jgi:PBSX family phage portal protein
MRQGFDMASKKSVIPEYNANNEFKKRATYGGRSPFVRGAAGTTSDISSLISGEKIQKGLFGLDNLSSFDTMDVPTQGSMTFSVADGLTAPQVISPVFSFRGLMRLYLTSTTLKECISAYKTNIESYGHTFVYSGKEGGKNSRASKQELARLEDLFGSFIKNGETFQQARENSRIDKEAIGARAFEVLKDEYGRPVGMNRVPSSTLLLTRLESEFVVVQVYNPYTGEYVEQKRRFRRYCQRNPFGHMIYFKELDDSRKINPQTGMVDNSLSIANEATSIYYDAYYTPGTPYGSPQWSACIPAMLGTIEAENVNYSFFKDNAVPAMAILVSGGALTEESFNKIESYFTQVRGAGSHNRIVVLEAATDIPDIAGVDGSVPAPKVDIKPMLSDRQHEGLFANYVEAGGEKIRKAFRLPPIYIGSAEEYNRASAFASVQVVEQQVFVPERMAWDTFVNETLLAPWNFRNWRVVTRSPAYNDPQEITKLVEVLGKEGGLTPNVCISIANRFMNFEIESIEDDWGDMPFLSTVNALSQGAKIKGFEYFTDFMQDLGQQAAEDSADQDSSEEELMISNSDPSEAMRFFIDEAAEKLSRATQLAKMFSDSRKD